MRPERETVVLFNIDRPELSRTTSIDLKYLKLFVFFSKISPLSDLSTQIALTYSVAKSRPKKTSIANTTRLWYVAHLSDYLFARKKSQLLISQEKFTNFAAVQIAINEVDVSIILPVSALLLRIRTKMAVKLWRTLHILKSSLLQTKKFQMMSLNFSGIGSD